MVLGRLEPEALPHWSQASSMSATDHGPRRNAPSSTVDCSISNFVARAPPPPSLIWAINSSPFKKAVPKPLTRAAISDLWSMIRMLSVKRYPKPVSNHCPARFSTFSTRGAIA